MIVEITQYHLPNGRTTKECCELSDDLHERYDLIKRCGLYLTAEVLTTGQISVALAHRAEEFDYDVEICLNAPGKPKEAIEKMLLQFDKEAFDTCLRDMKGGEANGQD